MNIVIPMAGVGSRFKKVGWDVPKPMIDIFGKSMIKWAVDSLGLEGNYIFIIQKEHSNKGLYGFLKKLYPNCVVLVIDYITQGPASSCLLAELYINTNEPLVIANCDQIMYWDVCKFIKQINKNLYDGIVVTYPSNVERNSYISIDSKGYGIKLAEKEVISNYSLNGIHFWKKGKDFVNSAKEMIREGDMCNDEFYISKTYNYMIRNGKKIGVHNIDKTEHHAVGTPNDLILFMLYYINGKI